MDSSELDEAQPLCEENDAVACGEHQHLAIDEEAVDERLLLALWVGEPFLIGSI